MAKLAVSSEIRKEESVGSILPVLKYHCSAFSCKFPEAFQFGRTQQKLKKILARKSFRGKVFAFFDELRTESDMNTIIS